ncbi:hypothetical protein FRC03_011250 [Tulasnella sp. 419]|nr:hypothetical protein FRC03_011250 [Tulasnella sp. 419]
MAANMYYYRPVYPTYKVISGVAGVLSRSYMDISSPRFLSPNPTSSKLSFCTLDPPSLVRYSSSAWFCSSPFASLILASPFSFCHTHPYLMLDTSPTVSRLVHAFNPMHSKMHILLVRCLFVLLTAP